MHFEVKRGKEPELIEASMNSDSGRSVMEITMNEIKDDTLSEVIDVISRTPLSNPDLIDFLRETGIPLDEILNENGESSLYLKDGLITRTLLRFQTLFVDVEGDHILYMGPSAGITFIYKNYKLLTRCFTLTLATLIKDGIIELVLDEGDTEELYTKYIACSNDTRAFTMLMDSLPQSDGDVYATIGRCYQMGYGVDIDYKAAGYYYRQGIRLNSPEAMYYYAECYMQGIGVKPSTKKASCLLIEASLKGSSSAMLELGRMYRDGIYFDINLNIAFTYFKMGAELGDEGCITEVGLFYLYGVACKRSVKKALECFKKISADEALRYYLIAKAYDDEENTDYNVDMIIDNYIRAIDLGYTDAYYDLAMIYLKADERMKAIDILTAGSKMGNKDCKRELKRIEKAGRINEAKNSIQKEAKK